MWRIFHSITKGARNVRPNHCCTQEAPDEQTYRCYYSGWPPLEEAKSTTQKLPSSRDNSEYSKKAPPLSGVARCAYNKYVRWNWDGKKKLDRPKVTWVWEIPNDVYPYFKTEWNDEQQREKWHRFYRRRQQLLRTNCILNGVGWGSAAAVTWTVCQYLRSTQACHKHSPIRQRTADTLVYDTTDSEDHTCLASPSNANQNSEHHEKDSKSFTDTHLFDDLQSTTEYWPPKDFHPHCNNFRSQDSLNHQQLTNFWHDECNSVVCEFPETRSFSHHFEKSSSNNEVRHHLTPDNASHVSLNYLFDDLDLKFDCVPQVVKDQEDLAQSLRKNRADSGYEEGVELIYNPSLTTQSESTDASCFAEDSVNGLSLESFQTDGMPHCNIENRKDIFSEEVTSSILEENSSIKQHTKEEVLIEDCSDDDSFQCISPSSSSQASGFEKSSLSSSPSSSSEETEIRSNTTDEFNDSLLEIIEAGKKDLNDFSNHLLGILESKKDNLLASKELEMAFPHFQAGALLGDAASSFNLALCYHLGQGVKQNMTMARELYEAASSLEHGWATYNLAVMVSKGEGGAADLTKGHTLLVKAAKLGVAEAKLALNEIEEMQDSNTGSKVSSSSKQRTTLASSQSETWLHSVPSQEWSSSYSTSDLDFLEDSSELMSVRDLSSLRISESPRFSLE